MSETDPQEAGTRAAEANVEAEEALTAEALEPADLSEEAGAGLDSSIPVSSESLYIVRESNALAELAEALGERGIELREEVADGGSEVPQEQSEAQRVEG